ncbi:MAG TPA: hypothetical protein VMW70_15780 [Burkholderiales bacterium]|nr:hypothetical protein [Burkholderiales bacterium]
MKFFLTHLAGLLALGCCAHSSAAPLHHYTVTVDDSLERLDVAACFDGPAPPMLAADDTAVLHLGKMQLRSAGKLTISGWEAALSEVPDDACVEYVVQLRPETAGAQTGGPETRRIGRDLLTSIGDWLWRPAGMEPGADIEVRFNLPPGVAVSTPWKRVGRNVYRVGATPGEWPGVVAFGGFEPIELSIPGARLELILIDNPEPAMREVLTRWIDRAARAVATVYGVFPVSSLQVIVSPTSRGNKPVPWAYVARGGGPAVHLFVRPNFPEGEFMRDWSVVHEMSHLFLPYMEWGDAWLVEGLPTYYQNVAMSRGGLIPTEEAWRRMYQGFERAESVGSKYTVYEAAERIGRRGMYRRVYWGGAAYMLAVDLGLRQSSSGSYALDTALLEIRRCCLDSNYRWRAEDVVARLDQVTGTEVFSTTFEQQIKSRPFPDYQNSFNALGIDILGGHPIFSDAESTPLRDAIMAPR